MRILLHYYCPKHHPGDKKKTDYKTTDLWFTIGRHHLYADIQGYPFSILAIYLKRTIIIYI